MDVLALLLFSASLVTDVRELIARNDLAAAERVVRAYQVRAGTNSELAAALSWIGRGALQAGNLDRAEALAAESRKIALDLQRKRGWDSSLLTAVGASIEVHARVQAARGERAEAVSYLKAQLASFRTTPLNERIQQNLNLLSLEGKPAPALQAGDWIGVKPPPLASLRGRPVLLFFWAHWCGDCKGMVPGLASIARKFGPKGLVLIGPTKLYGYVSGGQDAPPTVEKPYIDRIRQQYYSPLAGMPVPLSEANFQVYGASTTPTLVLIDAAGIVRLYHPGAMPEAELSARIQRLFTK